MLPTFSGLACLHFHAWKCKHARRHDMNIFLLKRRACIANALVRCGSLAFFLLWFKCSVGVLSVFRHCVDARSGARVPQSFSNGVSLMSRRCPFGVPSVSHRIAAGTLKLNNPIRCRSVAAPLPLRSIERSHDRTTPSPPLPPNLLITRRVVV